MQTYKIDHSKLSSYTIAELARLTGLHRNTISGFLSGQFSPYSTAFLTLCSALKLPPDSLIIKDDNQNLILQVKNILEREFSDQSNLAFLLFGSRLNGNYRRYSDLDLGITGGKSKLDLDKFLELKRQLEDAFDRLIIKVDVVNFDLAPDSFFKSFKKEPQLLFGANTTFNFFLGKLDEKQASK